MAQSGYTPIQLYYSTTAAAVPVNTNLASGELALNIQDEKLYFKNAAGTVKLLASNATSAPVTSFQTSLSGLTPSTATTGAVTLAGTLGTANGGTNLTSFTSGGVVYASSTSALTTGSALTFDGTNLGVGIASPVNKFAVASSGVGYEIDQTSIANTNLLLSYDRGASAYRSVANYYGGNYIWNDSGTEQMRLTSTGLGIGTSSPSYKLDVSGTGRISSMTFTPDGSYSAPYQTIGFSGNTNGKTRIFGTTNDSDNLYLAAGTGRGVTIWTNGSTSNVATFDIAGNLGLGVTPSAWSAHKVLQVGAWSSFGSYNGNFNAQMMNNAYWDGSAYRYIGSSQASYFSTVQGGFQWNQAPSGTAGDPISFTQAMTLDASGNLGVGTTSPASFGAICTRRGISVAGVTGSVSASFSDGAHDTLSISQDSGLSRLTFSALTFNTGTTERARITSTGGFSVGTTADPGAGAIYATGNITAYYSDDRLKTRLGNIENALDKVDQLQGFYYEANETAQALGYKVKREVGVSAQSVQAVLPEIVSPAPIDQQYLTVDYERLVPLLIEAVKELRAEVKALKGE